MSRDDWMDGAAAATTVADVRAYLRGDVINPEPGTLAHDIEEHVRSETALATVLSVAACILVGLVLLALSAGAQAQAIDRFKPAAISAPISGLYIDPNNPARYCVAQTGVFQPWGVQTFLHCAAGWNNAGHHVIAGIPQVGTEYLLYRLAGDTLLTPAVVNSVTITAAPPGQITVRFGTPGAQSGPYVLVLQ